MFESLDGGGQGASWGDLGGQANAYAEEVAGSGAPLGHASIAVRRAEFGAQPLSERERVALGWLARGFRVSRIAERMAITEPTVELHLRNARRKLNAATTPQAVARAIVIGEVAL